MPQVSIILPTYNRADTIVRAIRSVQAQTFTDWELLVVDDGSQDNTAALIAGLDPRLALIQQPNQGVTAARNKALSHCRGSYLAFLDSDDEWLPYHLELCLAFLNAHPAEQFVSCELLENFGNQRYVNHYQTEFSAWYPQSAAAIGSSALDLPPGETDNYLRIYQTRQPIGAWGEHRVARAAFPQAFHYRGQVFQHWRWGFLMWLPTTVIRREAAVELGAFDTAYPICSDFSWLADCCARFTANYLSIPTGIKHELTPAGRPLAEGHIAKQKTQHKAAQEMLWHFERNFCAAAPHDRELAALRSYKQLYVARSKISSGLRTEALHLLQAARAHSTQPWQVLALLLFLKLLPHPALCQNLYLCWFRLSYAVAAAGRGELTFGQLCSKLVERSVAHLRQLLSLRAIKPART